MPQHANRRRLAVDDRRAEIVAAAVSLLGKCPPDGLSLSAVAAEAGASRALVYHYFGDRKTLTAAAIRAVADDLMERLRPTGRHPVDELQHAVGEYLHFAENHGDGFLAILRGSAVPAEQGDEATRAVEEVRQAVLCLVTESLGIRRATTTLRLSVHAWVSFAQQMSLEWLSDRSLGLASVHRLLVRHLLATLAVAAETDGTLGRALERAAATTDRASIPGWLADALPHG